MATKEERIKILACLVRGQAGLVPLYIIESDETITNCTSWEGRRLAGQSPIRRSALWDFVYFLYFVVALIRKPFLHHFAPFSRSSFPSSLAHQPLTITNCTTAHPRASGQPSTFN